MSFGLDKQRGELLLQQKVLLEGLDAEIFYQRLQCFINWAIHWQDQLSTSDNENISSNSSEFEELDTAENDFINFIRV